MELSSYSEKLRGCALTKWQSSIPIQNIQTCGWPEN
jgi:hypothetical protein